MKKYLVHYSEHASCGLFISMLVRVVHEKGRGVS